MKDAVPTEPAFPAMAGACVLVANRGECACRIIKSCQQLGLLTIAVYTEPDRTSLHTRLASQAVRIRSYLDAEELVQAALDTRATAIHPGWGFLSENPKFPEACSSKGIKFIGPTAENMRKLAEKTGARNLASKLGIPITPGSGILRDVEEAVTVSNEIGYPVMLKAAYGGGGIGINKCNNELQVRKNFDVSKQQALKAFGNSVMFVEKCIKEVQHVEVQVFGDGDGQVVVMGERECSVQRRYQKVLEATPAPGLTDEARRNILEAARTLTKSIQYQSAGTVEFLINRQTKEFFFMEVNMRLQVRKTSTTILCNT